MEFKCENNVLTIALPERIDSGNAPEIDAAIMKISQGNAHEKMILDYADVVYISSAGLRVNLKLKKTEKELLLRNMSSDVYEIFDMTGFTDIIDIEKAHRKMTVEGCDLIGRGAKGAVYRKDPETIIKVYFNDDAVEDAKREQNLARMAFVAGVPTAISYDIVDVDGKTGAVFELLNADSLGKQYRNYPEKREEYLKTYVEVIREAHQAVTDNPIVPDARLESYTWIKAVKGYLPDEVYDKLSRMVYDVPEDNHMVHGDFHMMNIMMQNGEAMIIDLDTLSHGFQVYEFAQIYNAYVGFGELNRKEAIEYSGLTYDESVNVWNVVWNSYYSDKTPEERAEMEKIVRVMSALKLMSRPIRKQQMDTEMGKHYFEVSKQHILELINEVDKLYY